MFKCTGICSRCGRCKGAVMQSSANIRKTKMLNYPGTFRPETGKTGLGVAFDIGTTTVVGMLWDLNVGKQIATCAKTNPQNEFGMDVVSRITYCGERGENFLVLQDRIIGCLNEIIGELCAVTDRSRDEIEAVAICGNTTMSHIVAGFPPMSLLRKPFAPAYTGTLRLRAEELKLEIKKGIPIVILPNIGGHVGGDITAGIVASRILDEKDLTVFIDIGTNGEIVLTDGEKIFACSTAAGPAFEGSAILHGMRAANGAIERVRIEDDGEVLCQTIGGYAAQGICGSGLIDAIAQMLKVGLISKSGRLLGAEQAKEDGYAPNLIERLVEREGERRFILLSRENGEDIVITQKDIREVQLAKGAVAAGISLMLERAGRTEQEIRKVIVAGAFGNYIDRESAVTIGILPNISLERILTAGNTAGAGVSMTLVSDEELALAERVPDDLEHMDLGTIPTFQKKFLESMSFQLARRTDKR